MSYHFIRLVKFYNFGAIKTHHYYQRLFLKIFIKNCCNFNVYFLQPVAFSMALNNFKLFKVFKIKTYPLDTHQQTLITNY